MGYPIALHLVEQSRLSGIDFQNLPFGSTFSDHMFTADYANGQWHDLQIVPYGPLTISPANMALNYGQSIFEGMKAERSAIDGTPQVFRADLHAKRFNRSAERMAMPTIPDELFIEAILRLVGIDADWVPYEAGSALYIRPMMFASEEHIGVRASNTYKFIIMTGPVGLYYTAPVKLLVADKYVRAAKGGVGSAKTSGNYAASMYPAKLAKEQGYDQILWLDGVEFQYLQESGTMNLFVVIGDTVLTPPIGDTILAGVTRDSILKILEAGGFKAEVRPITIKEVVAAYESGQLTDAFGAGTAATVAVVSEIKHGDLNMILPPTETRFFSNLLKKELNEYKRGIKPDSFGWNLPVLMPQAASV